MKRVVQAWNNFWFKPGSLVDLAMFRIIAVGSQTAAMFILRNDRDLFPELVQLPHMYNPLALVRFLMRPVGVDWFPPLEFLVAVFWATAAFGFLALFGVLTRVTIALFALGTAYMQAYAYSFGDFHHAEALMTLALAFLALSPCGRRLSVDSWFRRRRRPEEGLPTDDEFARWPFLMLMAMFTLAYFSAGWCKLVTAGLDWFNGHTLQYYLLQDSIRWNMPLGRWLAGQHEIAWLMSVACVAFELGFVAVFFSRKILWFAIPFGIGMHVGIWVLMRAMFWEYCALYLALIPWRDLAAWWRSRSSLTKV